MFITDDFLLTTATARFLYHTHAASLPIIDYHCHLVPAEIAEDKHYDTITQLWLADDHYKWRALRANGVPEVFITGNASDEEKFLRWAETVPYTLRNPLYHWTHLELTSAFGISDLLSPTTAEDIYRRCNAMLHTAAFSARGLLRHYNVEVVCTTDDPCDTLAYHRQMREENCDIRMLPAWRPDKALAMDDVTAYNEYIDRLEDVCKQKIRSVEDLLRALRQRHDFFHTCGCRLADHGLDELPTMRCSREKVQKYWREIRRGEHVEHKKVLQIQGALLGELCRMNHEKGWVQQFHYGALRNVNTRAYRQLGANTGYDSIGDGAHAHLLGALLDALASSEQLAKTIIYNINPCDNAVVATMIGNFQDGSTPGKMQFGAGWWFNDQQVGIAQQIETLSLHGLLRHFVGMLTDSRSLLSFSRHDYFRRLLCDILGRDIEEGRLPEEALPQVEQMVEDICYYNAKRYFPFFDNTTNQQTTTY